MNSTITPLYGLLLTGGKSSRMGKDKSLLCYHAAPEWRWLINLLEEHCEVVSSAHRNH